MFFRLTSKFRAENVIKAWLFLGILEFLKKSRQNLELLRKKLRNFA